jgi:hypothetical protein
LTLKQVTSLTDDELCTAIASGGEARNRAIETIYQWRDMKEKVMQYVKQHGGQKQDGLDTFHDGIIALDTNIRSGRYRAESGLQGFKFYPN